MQSRAIFPHCASSTINPTQFFNEIEGKEGNGIENWKCVSCSKEPAVNSNCNPMMRNEEQDRVVATNQ